MELVRGRLDVLLNLTAGLAERMDIRSIADFVLGVGRDAIDANRGTLCLITNDGEWLEVVGQVGYDADMMSVWQRFSLADALPASDAVRTASAVYLHDPEERARRYPMFADTGGDGASVMLPLLVRERAIGSLVFGFDGPRSFDADDRQFLNALSTQCAIAVDRARLYEQSLRRQANLALLVDASAVLAAARDDIEQGLSRLAPQVAPTVCDIFSVRLLSPTRSTRLVARSFSDRTLLSETQRVSDFGADFWAKDGLGRALRTGHEVVWDDGDRFIERIARDDEHRQALEAMELGAGIIVPMTARELILGACVFANHRGRPMTEEDRDLARTLTERMAVLIDNGRLLRQRTEISHELQAALLPPTLPTIEGFQVAARYQPAGEGLEVGGDFYDVVPLEQRKWLLVVGDVTGHGTDAAAATGLVRHTIRSVVAMGETSPPEIIERVNAALLERNRELHPPTFCTIAVVLLHMSAAPGTSDGHERWLLTVSCGGHPPPLLRRADGSVAPISSTGRLLGFFETVDAGRTIIPIDEGDTLVAVTDGVVERRSRGRWFDGEDLRRLVAAADSDADELAALIRNRVVNAFDDPPVDDMAILVLRRR